MMGFGMGFGWIIGLLFLGLIVWLVIDQRTPNRLKPPENSSDALTILRKRYATGEINRDTYYQMRKELQS